MAELNFNANEVEPTTAFEPLPAGKYLATITESVLEATKAGTGHFLRLTFTLADGPHRGRTLFARLNLHNPNTVAVQIAKAELSAICRAVGVMQPKDSIELHNLPLIIVVKCVTRKDNGEITNEIKGYEKRQAEAVTQPVQQPGADTAPWAGAPAGQAGMVTQPVQQPGTVPPQQ